MPSEEKQKINVWIPGSLWKQIGSLGYESPTKATIAAFEALVLQEAKGSNQEVLGSSQEEVRKLQVDVRKYQEENRKLQEEIGRAPDLVTFAQLQARYEGLQGILKEKEKSMERLENDLTKAGQREEDLKQMHNNYMLQVQSLINQRALSAPAGSMTTKEATRKKQEETGSNQEENRKFNEEITYAQNEERLYGMVREKPDVDIEKKGSLEITCLNCGEVFTAERSTRKFCSGKCKAAYYRKKSKEEII